MSQKPFFVTQPMLPPLEDFIPYLQQIWDSKILTNNGPMHQQLELELAVYLGVPYVALFNNGMTALLTALQVMEVKGEVITTPYSFVATTHAIDWNKAMPVFVDIDPKSLNLDAAKIEAAVTNKTTAILPVHCYGNPCDTTAIKAIADKYNLKVIYDAAHAFGVRDVDGSILRHGDLSILSFHATKVFNTFEGGAIICHTAEMKKKIDLLKNFGIENDVTVTETGINGKMSEVNAAFGLLQLKHVDKAIKQRKEIDRIYRRGLEHVKGINLLKYASEEMHNYAYFPIFITEECSKSRDELYQKLRDNNIFARRYFYPLISSFKTYKNLDSSQSKNLKSSIIAASQVLCLPIYPGLDISQQEKIINLLGG